MPKPAACDSKLPCLQGLLRGEDLSAAYASGDVFMMPSESETLGFVALEAMASGLPVVAVAAGGLTDILTNPGVTGGILWHACQQLHGQRKTLPGVHRLPQVCCTWCCCLRKGLLLAIDGGCGSRGAHRQSAQATLRVTGGGFWLWYEHLFLADIHRPACSCYFMAFTVSFQLCQLLVGNMVAAAGSCFARAHPALGLQQLLPA